MYQTIRLEQQDGIAYLTICRPEVLNALNAEVLGEIEDVVIQLETAKEVKALIVTGEGRAFVAGADIGAQSVLDLEGGRSWGKKDPPFSADWNCCPWPTIAAVNGFALGGGCELAMACDMILASEKAKFGQPEVGLGITPGFSGTQRLARKVGKAKAMELILTGEMIRADEALRIGLVNQVVAPEELLPAAKKLAEKILKNGPLGGQVR